MTSTKSRVSPGKLGRRLSFVLILLICAWLLAWAAARWIIVRVPLESADAILILSGSSTLRERTEHAARLYKAGHAGRILLTRDEQRGSWSQAEQRNPFFYESAVAELRRQGVPAQNIEVIGPPVQSTWEEAVAVRDYVREHSLRSLLIVTSSYHSRRAFWTFERHFAGQNVVIGIDPVPTGIQTPRPALWWLSGKGWQVVFLEYLKLIYYCCRRP